MRNFWDLQKRKTHCPGETQKLRFRFIIAMALVAQGAAVSNGVQVAARKSQRPWKR